MNTLFFLSRRALLWALSLLALGLLLAGCGASGTTTTTTPASTTSTPAPLIGSFVGKVASTDAYIGLVSDGKKALAYICDGTPAGVKLLNWFKGSVNGTHVELTTAKKEHLTATLTSTSVSGTITRSDGRTLSFTAQAVTGDVGLYRAEQTGGVSVVAGWVLLPDGTQRGALSKQAHSSSVPRLNPANLHVTLVDGTALAARQVTPSFMDTNVNL